MHRFPWYDVVTEDAALAQGDFIELCPVIVPLESTDKEQELLSSEIIDYSVIVVSQSCDLVYQKLSHVLVCPFWPYKQFADRNDYFQSKEGKRTLKRGNVPGFHLLNKCDLDGFQSDYLVVDFHNVYSVPLEFITKLVRERGNRLRLLPPYREHLSQAFARFFMRVGLPVDISSFV